MQFGTRTETTHYRDGKATVVVVLSERVKVSTPQEELSVMVAFHRDIPREKRVSLTYDHPGNSPKYDGSYYYVVKTWKE